MSAERKPERVKPPALRRGDRVAIVAPASSFNRSDFEAGCDALRVIGYQLVFSDSVFDRDLYFAGSAERRARELEEMFARDDVKGIVCARGGYGSNYLLPVLDIKRVAAQPKVFVGYSDLTSLMTYFYDAAGLVTFHGPMVAKDFAKEDGVDVASWESALGGGSAAGFDFVGDSDAKTLVEGAVEGIIYGGCLSMLVASLGTPYEIQTEGTILFIEDIATKPYQIDRMLMQLKLAGKLSGVRGIVFGEMLDCAQPGDQRYTLEDVVLRVVRDLKVPIAYGLRSGHASRANITLPIGVPAQLDVGTSRVSLTITESPTS
jgi:muramoyltetrapeptide carboxypeptidase